MFTHFALVRAWLAAQLPPAAGASTRRPRRHRPDRDHRRPVRRRSDHRRRDPGRQGHERRQRRPHPIGPRVPVHRTSDDDNASRALGVRRRDDGGYSVVEAAITLPALILFTMLVVQWALLWHGRHVVEAAVQDGVRAARAYQATAADGQHSAQAYLHAVAPTLLTAPQVDGVPDRDHRHGPDPGERAVRHPRRDLPGRGVRDGARGAVLMTARVAVRETVVAERDDGLMAIELAILAPVVAGHAARRRRVRSGHPRPCPGRPGRRRGRPRGVPRPHSRTGRRGRHPDRPGHPDRRGPVLHRRERGRRHQRLPPRRSGRRHRHLHRRPVRDRAWPACPGP